MVEVSDRRLRALEKEVEELRDFKMKIELGSYWLRCVFYTIGSIAVFMAALFAVIKDWPFK